MKEIKTLVNKKSVSLLFCHTSYTQQGDDGTGQVGDRASECMCRWLQEKDPFKRMRKEAGVGEPLAKVGWLTEVDSGFFLF